MLCKKGRERAQVRACRPSAENTVDRTPECPLKRKKIPFLPHNRGGEQNKSLSLFTPPPPLKMGFTFCPCRLFHLLTAPSYYVHVRRPKKTWGNPVGVERRGGGGGQKRRSFFRKFCCWTVGMVCVRSVKGESRFFLVKITSIKAGCLCQDLRLDT